MPDADPPLAPEDAKLVTLSRSARARTGAAEGACVRDLDGRTYAGATVDLPSLRLSAVALCVAMASASAAKGLEAAAVVTEADEVSQADLDAVRDLAGSGITVLRVAPDGRLLDRLTT